MKRALILAIALLTTAPAYAESTDATLDGIIKDAKKNFEKLTVLDKSDKALKASNDAQIKSTEQAKKLRREVSDAKPPLQMEASRADEMRNRILAMGCPEHGGSVSLELAQRCNPFIEQHQALHDVIARKAQELQNKVNKADALEKEVTRITLKNTEQQKRNEQERASLQAQKIEIQSRAVIAGLRNKTAAAKACGSMPTPEGQTCCNSTVFDGADPKKCNIALLCQIFERAGLFGVNVVICHASN